MSEGKANTTLGIALLALLLSLISVIGVCYLCFRADPLGKGLAKYDFTTPTAALKSQLQMEMNLDIKAQMELQRKTNKKNFAEKLASLEVKKEAEWGGKKILFVSFKKDGVSKYETQSFEKHADSGYWMHAYVSTYDVKKDNKELAELMETWVKSGSLEPKPVSPEPKYGDKDKK